VNKRQFGIEDDQIVLYTTMMYVLRGQLMDHSDRSIGCLNCDHLAEEPVRRPDMKRLLDLFGIEERAVRDTYRPPAATNSTMSPNLQIYMDTYVETSRTVWETCTALSHNGWFNFLPSALPQSEVVRSPLRGQTRMSTHSERKR
jgi:hypothetical protein